MQPLAQTRHAVPVLFPATRGNPHTKLWPSIYATAGYSLVGTLHNFPVHPLPTTKLEELEVSCAMLRASRSATADHIRILLQQLLFFHRVRIAARRLEEQLEETLDDLYDLGFDGQLLSNQLRVTHAELGRFITRCDHAMQTTEQRILQLYTR